MSRRHPTVHDHDGEPVTPWDVLDHDELGNYFADNNTCVDGYDHDWLSRPESDTYQCLICGAER